MNTYFSADYHVGHGNVIGFCNRPFTNAYTMIEAIIKNHNKIVKPNDHFYHIGDFSFQVHNKTIEILKRLNGKKFMILGNHDKVLKKPDVQHFIEWAKERYNLTIQDINIRGKKQLIILDHYAGRTWYQSHRNSYQLYGHSHGNLDELAGVLAMDVGVDAVAKRLAVGGILKPEDYRPISYNEIKIIMEKKKNEI